MVFCLFLGIFGFLIKDVVNFKDFYFLSNMKSNVKFKDVKGIDEYLEEIEDLVDFFKNP